VLGGTGARAVIPGADASGGGAVAVTAGFEGGVAASLLAGCFGVGSGAGGVSAATAGSPVVARWWLVLLDDVGVAVARDDFGGIRWTEEGVFAGVLAVRDGPS
jgi:hypothetical protein